MRILLTWLFLLWPALAQAEMHEVRMLNRNEIGAMIYAPSVLRIAPGDSVRFVAASSGHNAASIDGMLPNGVVPFKGGINEEITLTLTEPGVYGVKCTPHFAMGMVMLIVVGDVVPSHDALPEGLPRRAEARLRDYIEAAR
ncbi:pseudoazurin [Roseovarius sp. C7]|uniref:pseudoazurin n=1 Tax=Roseovarius sp. C7 TaxID=3398643 RepID=UPI0039F73D34